MHFSTAGTLIQFPSKMNSKLDLWEILQSENKVPAALEMS